MGLVKETTERALSLNTPTRGMLAVVLAIVNLFIWGVGTIIGGIVDKSVPDIIIGLLQLIPILGWSWSIFWGVLMIIRNL